MQNLWERARAKKIQLKVSSEPGLKPIAVVDRAAWKQVFINLVDNGIKYGLEGGSVTVSLQGGPSRYLMIIVADDGQGINPDESDRLFSIFYRSPSHSHIKGSGLGLAIVRRIVEQHNGKIECRNNDGLGQGTIFEMDLLQIA